jgi:hypothetical protein
MKLVIYSLLMFILVSCNEDKKIEKTELSPNSMRGHYTWGHEVNVFTPCDRKETYWVVGEAALLKDLEVKYEALTKEPYEKVFAVVEGELKAKDPNSDGFDSNYDGLISINELKSMAKSSDGDCK